MPVSNPIESVALPTAFAGLIPEPPHLRHAFLGGDGEHSGSTARFGVVTNNSLTATTFELP